MKNKTIVISGSHGFIATHLINRLAGQNNINAIPRTLLYQPKQLKIEMEKIQPDYIFHLAASGNHSYQTDNLTTYFANSVAQFNLLEAGLGVPYKAFFNFSTTHHNLEAGSFYGSTKAGGEYLTKAYVRNHHKPIINIRPYSIFGEYEWDFRFIPTISRQIKAGEPITVSDVDHDWTYVEDFIDGLLRIEGNIPELIGKSVGIGSGKRTSNVDIAKLLMKTVGKEVEIKEGVKRQYEIAAYGEELQSVRDKDETFFKENTTPIEDALSRVYESSDLWLKRNEQTG